MSDIVVEETEHPLLGYMFAAVCLECDAESRRFSVFDSTESMDAPNRAVEAAERRCTCNE